MDTYLTKQAALQGQLAAIDLKIASLRQALRQAETEARALQAALALGAPVTIIWREEADE